MQSNITKSNLEKLILQTIQTGSLKEDALPVEHSDNLTSKAISISRDSFELWSIIFERGTSLDEETLYITKIFYNFISNIPNCNISLYLNCTSLLNSYLDFCLNNSPSYISLIR